HVADLLAAAGDTDVIGVRRAKALGVLANPAQACLLLAGKRSDTAPSTEPADGEPAMPTAAQLGVAFGQVLADLGADAWKRLRPRSVLYLHVAEEAVRGSLPGGDCGVVRVEGPGPAGGAITPVQLREWLANDQVVVKPVLDPMGQSPVDAYEIPDRHRESTILLNPFEVFPFGTLPSRRADLDHSEAFRERERAPGQTRTDNLGPLGRGHHRAKTIGGFALHQPLPGLYLWRTPTGHWFQVSHRGTRSLGRHTPEIITQQRSPARMSPMDLAFTELVLAS
ncbi:MAG: hypothetical protein QOK15_2591, partial [Nocardioidaceae bacterium]|nr:hypothetical protein [Nocardioidaceae bacterium]